MFNKNLKNINHPLPITFAQLPKDGRSLKNILDQSLVAFNQNALGQYQLSIPSGTVLKIDEIRNNEFAYLKDSVYKSNISYLMQQINFQLWIYKVFKISLSLENSFFYNLKILLGVMTETLVAAMVYNPLIQEESDRSLGDIDESYMDIRKAVADMPFSKIISLAKALELLPNQKDYFDKLNEIRQFRNDVHLQDKQERIYNNMNKESFSKVYNLVKSTFQEIRNYLQENPLHHNSFDLRRTLFQYTEDQKNFYQAKIDYLDYQKRQGSLTPKVEDYPARASLYFFEKDVSSQIFTKLKRGQRVSFRFAMQKNGLIASDIRPL